MFQPGMFEDLQRRFDEDSATLRELATELEKHDRRTQSILAQVHSSTAAGVPGIVAAAQESIVAEVGAIQSLANTASKHPYYRFNNIWSRPMQDACLSVLFCGYLGGFSRSTGEGEGRLLTINEVGAIMRIPANVKDDDTFHLTIEEYLHALVSLLEELSRLARNSVTLGDYQRAPRIAQFIKDVFNGFQVLNLKNDSLRKRSDSIKYKVKDVEDVMYDLGLRGLLPKQ